MSMPFNFIIAATEFCQKAHKGQIRRFTKDEPYSEHPIRVMNKVLSHSEKLQTLTAALFHDVIEDTTTSYADIFKFIEENYDGNCKHYTGLNIENFFIEVSSYIKALTNDYDNDDFYHRDLHNSSDEVKLIKLLDIYDNCIDAPNVPNKKYAFNYLNKKIDMLHLLYNNTYPKAFLKVAQVLMNNKDIMEQKILDKEK